jgi:hypothetical protein
MAAPAAQQDAPEQEPINWDRVISEAAEMVRLNQPSGQGQQAMGDGDRTPEADKGQ